MCAYYDVQEAQPNRSGAVAVAAVAVAFAAVDVALHRHGEREREREGGKNLVRTESGRDYKATTCQPPAAPEVLGPTAHGHGETNEHVIHCVRAQDLT